MNSETIYTTLKHRILDLTLKPGQSMSEHELCERFGVSRTPVRTAVESQVILDFLPVRTPLLEEKIRYQIRKQMALIQGEFELYFGNILSQRRRTTDGHSLQHQSARRQALHHRGTARGISHHRPV